MSQLFLILNKKKKFFSILKSDFILSRTKKNTSKKHMIFEAWKIFTKQQKILKAFLQE